MKLLIMFLSFMLTMPVVNAHNANIKGYKDKESKYISNCDNKYYGYHKKNGQNHWHQVELNNNEWKIVNADMIYENDPCLSDSKIPVSLSKCVDGDTAIFKMENEEIKFRFLAVDTPESVHPTKEIEVYAKEASKNTCDLLTNASSIYIEYDKNSDKTDKYGRNLAWIWIDDILLQELMINEGFARVAYVYGNYKYLDQLCDLQIQAINNNKGIWKYGYEMGYCETKKSNLKDKKEVNKLYKVTFMNGDIINEVAVAEGMRVKELDGANRLGYVFLGWYLNGTKYDFNTPINSDITLVANYRIDYVLIIVIIMFISISRLIIKKEDRNGKNYKKSVKPNRKKRV